VRGFSQRSAYTSPRAANRARKNATFAAGADPASTGPGGRSKNPVWAGPGGLACAGVSSSSRSSLPFSARNRSTWARNPANSNASTSAKS
jgi:hypothetical protein